MNIFSRVQFDALINHLFIVTHCFTFYEYFHCAMSFIFGTKHSVQAIDHVYIPC